MRSHAQEIADVLSIEKVNENEYFTKNDWYFPVGVSVYGGQLIGQSLAAAALTVEEGFIINSLTSYFHIGAKYKVPLSYHVERIRDGKSFVSRRVVAVQSGKQIYTMSCSFHKPNLKVAPSHQYEMPKVLPPGYENKILGDKNSDSGHLYFSRFPVDFSRMVMKDILTTHAVAIPKDYEQNQNYRMAVKKDLDELSDQKMLEFSEKHIKTPYYNFWLKIHLNISKENTNLHVILLAMISDLRLIIAANLPHLYGYNHNKGKLKAMMSLDHTIRFHTYDIDAVDWFLYELDSERAAGERSVSIGKIFNPKTGVHIATICQEHLCVPAQPSPLYRGDFTFYSAPPELVDSQTSSDDADDLANVVVAKL